MLEQYDFIQHKKSVGKFFLLCLISCVLALGIFWLVTDGEYVKDKHLTITASIMLIFGMYLDFFKQKKSAFEIAILAIIGNIFLIALVQDFYGLLFFLNVFLYVISIADYCYFLDYSEDKLRNYFINLILMVLFLVFYIGSVSVLYAFISFIQSV